MSSTPALNRPAPSFAVAGKDINLIAANDELDTAIESLTTTLRGLKESMATIETSEAEWNKRISKVEVILAKDEDEQTLSDAQKETLAQLLLRAQQFARLSASSREQTIAEIQSYEKHLQEAEKARNKIAAMITANKISIFPLPSITEPASKSAVAPPREIRSAIATAEALITLREGK